jgi:coenzyme F420-reducing hydrogenase beta subunit
MQLMDKVLPILCSDNGCSGCSACASICEADAITMIRNEEGFYRPSVDVETCIGCHQCERKCPVLYKKLAENSIAKVYAAWHKDAKVRADSSSGGAFSALAETVLNEQGVVVGAAYTENLMVSHICITNKEDLSKIRLSKYVQSHIGTTFKQIKTYLKEDKRVLFCGTPCQVAGLKAYLGKESDNLICCDFICHGVPSPLMLDKYLNWLESRIGAVHCLNFRDKRKGWYDSLRTVILKNGKSKILRGKKDAFWVGFNNNNNLQPACYHCQYIGFNRNADITIADFWGIGKEQAFGHKAEIEKGVSMVMANSKKGLILIQESAMYMELFERDKAEVVARNQAILHSSERPKSRDTFYHDLRHISFDEIIKKYLIPNKKTKLVKLMREYFPYSLIAIIRTMNQK